MQRKPAVIDSRARRGLSAVPARYGFLLASVLPLCIASAHAVELSFSDGEVTGRFDNTLSYGVAVRTQGANGNLAADTVGAGPTGYYTELAGRNVKTQANKNDGNNNFPDSGDIVSNTVKLNSLLELTWRDFGAQVSGFAFYDKALADIDGTAGSDSDFLNAVNAQDQFTNQRLSNDAADYAVSDVRLSSAYVWGDIEVGDRNLNIRFGQQVLSWGEALFMQDGINQVNPADLSALRLPGAEIKDALLPLPMLVLSTSLTDSLSAEAFYEFGWKRSEADPVGTFYSTTDAFFGHGSEAVIVDLEGTSAESLARLYNVYHRGTDPNSAMGSRLSNNKLDDVEPPDDGQFGFAFRYLAESLNNTEFGVYFINYHARKPTAGAVLGESLGSANDQATCDATYAALQQASIPVPANCALLTTYLTGVPGGATGASIVGGMNAVHYMDSTKYFLQYEDNLQVYGFTFSSNIGSTSLSGEFAYRPDAEFLPEVGDNLIAYNLANAAALGNDALNAGVSASAFGDHIGSGTLYAGQTVDVTDNADMLNVSLLAIQNFGPTLGMDGLTGVLELGGAWVNGLKEDQMYGAEGALGYVPGVLVEGNPDQYLDDFSWGYRLVLAAEFNDVAAGLNLKPQVRFAHDVEGNGVIGGNFMEDRMSATVALNAEYAGNWTFGVGANAFWGRDDLNEGNQLADRDNVFANVKYSF